MSFFFIEHFFQFFLLFISFIYFIAMFIVKSIILKYPEMLIDGLSIIQILTYPFKKHDKVTYVKDKITKVEDKYDEYEEKYDNFVTKLFYPMPYVLFSSSMIGYGSYYFIEFESSIIFNLLSLIIIYMFFKHTDYFRPTK